MKSCIPHEDYVFHDASISLTRITALPWQQTRSRRRLKLKQQNQQILKSSIFEIWLKQLRKIQFTQRRGIVVALAAPRRDDGAAADAGGTDPAPQEIPQRRAESRRRERVQRRIQCGIHRQDEHDEPATEPNIAEFN